MIRGKITPEGRQILTILMTKYQMPEPMAIKLMQDGGQMLAVSILAKGGIVMKSNQTSELSSTRLELRQAKSELLRTRAAMKAMMEGQQ